MSKNKPLPKRGCDDRTKDQTKKVKSHDVTGPKGRKGRKGGKGAKGQISYIDCSSLASHQRHFEGQVFTKDTLF